MSNDPLSQLLLVLGAKVIRRTRLQAAGDWALAFPARDRLKFVALLKGEQWMSAPGHAPRLMRRGDVCLIGPTPYTVASAPGIEPIDGGELYLDGDDLLTLGGDDTIGIGGSVAFAASDASFLLQRLPPFMLVAAEAPGSETITSVLALLDRELHAGTLGAAVVSARLADVLLVEGLRAFAEQQGGTGWLGALVDPRLGRALHAMHADIVRRWTVADLAMEAAMSRAAFAAAFVRRVGSTPLGYLRSWRLAVAKATLERTGCSVAMAAADVGYGSQSAFAQAYRRHFGHAPRNRL